MLGRRGLIVLLAIALLGGGLALWSRARDARLAAIMRACAAQTVKLDKGLRARFPRAIENLGEPFLSRRGHCLALLEYHYRPCTAAERKASPQSCGGPDADIGLYDVGRGRLLLSCEKRGAAAECGEGLYGTDGKLLSFSPITPENFAERKAALLAQ